MKELVPILNAFHAATGCDIAVWIALDGRPRVACAAPREVRPPADVSQLPLAGERARVEVPDGNGTLALLVAGVPFARPAWVAIGPCPGDPTLHEKWLGVVVPVVAQHLQVTTEAEHAATELAERYEEINLLYATSEILGRTVSMTEAAEKILTEISETVGTRRGAILVHDRVTDTLQVVAALGVEPVDAPPIAVDDASAVGARVYRTQHALLVEAGEMPCEAEQAYRRGAMLCVPILWTNVNEPEPLGVVCLSDRRAGQAFTAGDQKLVQAIASQIGIAIQNTRLVRTSLAQQRLVQEMELAHDLQMKLLPSVSVAEPEARVAARVVPAESVGGDFYHLFRLGGGKVGVMIGDVSSHGYRAALIMALAMSAAAIHAQGSDDPAATIAAVQRSLSEELETTEMFITAFYAVLDPRRGTLRWANAGHPHAFILGVDGVAERLSASEPPIGMFVGTPRVGERPWHPGADTLLLFTDGISDARNRTGARMGEEQVLDVVSTYRHATPEEISRRVFATLDDFTGGLPPRDDLTLVVVQSGD
jgi:sigma-B regulation protein RsbU (phosphoserine phosphatase)